MLTPTRTHPHTRPPVTAEVPPAPSPVAAVVLDIGQGIGALVIHTPAWLEGREIEIRPVDTDWLGVHTGVRRRLVPPGVQWAAVFGALPEGRYELRVKGGDGPPALSVTVAGAAVTETAWPDSGDLRP